MTLQHHINQNLLLTLKDFILTPESGYQKIRRVLHSYGVDMPPIYGLNREGDETYYDIESFVEDPDGPDFDDLYLYIIYVLEDNGYYDFFAQLVNQEQLEEFFIDD